MLEQVFLESYSPFIVLALSLILVAGTEFLAGSVRDDGVVFQRWVLGAGLWACSALMFLFVVSAVESLAGSRFVEFSWFAGLTTGWQVLLLLLIADFLHYWTHRLLHMQGFWRVHAVHHQDRVFSAATALRFHPAEVLLGAGVRYLAFRLMGADPLSALLAAHVITVWNVCQHAQLPPLSPAISGVFRYFFMSSGRHQTHHALDESLRNKNFGLLLTFWDRVFGTFSPVVEYKMRVGVSGEAGSDDMVDSLIQPFRSRVREG